MTLLELLSWSGILIMPVTYGFTGWLTNIVAIKMMFYPVKFRGIPPFLGWQGIVPRRAAGLALKSVNMISGKVFRINEFFEKVPGDLLSKQFTAILHQNIPAITEHLLHGLPDELNARLTTHDHQEIYRKAEKESLQKMNEITSKLAEDAAKVFNFKNLVLRSLTGPNVHRIIDMFQSVGSKEFKFIGRSGWYFGATLGLVQMVLWLLFPLWWTLPIQGAFVGYITNYLALYMIFRPRTPKKIGPVRYQGLFLKRQAEVSEKYAELLAEYVLNPRNIMEEIVYRRVARATVDVIQQDIIKSLESKELDEELTAMLETYRASAESSGREDVTLVVDMLSTSAETIEKMLARAMSVKKTIAARMKELPPDEFEPILRSAFQEDEWILIVLGAFLGATVGMAQAAYMLFLGG